MKQAILLLIALCLFSACMKTTLTGPHADFDNADRLFKENKFEEAVAGYQRIISDAPDSEWAENARFGIAFTHAYYDNPKKDYAHALREFDEFLKLYPNGQKAQEARNWRSAIKTILDMKKENDRLKKNIEQLRKLDVRREEKRGK